MAREQRTARLTILIDPRKKAVFENLCAAQDVTPSQVVRSLIRRYIEERLGEPWRPEDPEGEESAEARPSSPAPARQSPAARQSTQAAAPRKSAAARRRRAAQ
ncbi:MAG TPA: CopG family transcriptional regulator [Gammaproteobacteria bacterium]|nr:CopG family transcriptional regulator [Gammaproteobacteria bacterium]